jgi:myo-inositol-1(or 4)-monophosphatase
VLDDLYVVEKGHGAYLNNKRLRVASRKELGPSLVATGFPFKGREGHEQSLAEIKLMMAETAGIRRFGTASLDLAFVAAGRFDAFWERGIQAWDMAAGILLVREAGGMVSDLEGGQDMLSAGSVLVANEYLQPQLLRLLKATKPEKSGH